MFIFEGLSVEADISVTHSDGSTDDPEQEKDKKEDSE